MMRVLFNILHGGLVLLVIFVIFVVGYNAVGKALASTGPSVDYLRKGVGGDPSIYRIHDDLMQVTCWVCTRGGISCLIDSELDVSERFRKADAAAGGPQQPGQRQ